MLREWVLEDVVADFRAMHVQEYEMVYHYITVMLTLMRAAGWTDMNYETLAVESGVGLSFGYKRNHCIAMYGLQGSAPPRMVHTTGFELEWVTHDDLDEAWAWVKETLD